MKNFIKGTVFGVIIGSAVVALTTPKNGKEVRDAIKEESINIYNEGQDKFEDLQKETIKLKEKSLDKLKERKEEISSKVNEIKSKEKKEFNTNLEDLKGQIKKEDGKEIFVESIE